MSSKKNLVIVESPSKAKTIEKFLGSKYKVIASKGHIRDLPKSTMGVDIANNFEPNYINVRGKGDLIKDIKKAAKEADNVLLATDPDREGEAIAWHICNVLGIKPENANRIEFHEITKPAVTAAVSSPRNIDMNLVDAQQGRRITDRIVGYGISPVLWAKAGKGLSAGRVQSVALEIICNREDEITNFNSKPYYSISVNLAKDGLSVSAEKKTSFIAKLDKISGNKVITPDESRDATISTKEYADEIVSELSNEKYIVENVENKPTSTKPYAPYTTSVLQQDASVRLNFPPKKTMSVAQSLYEGVSVKGHGTVGLITYMRTDSVRISPIADAACKDYIKEKFGDSYVGNNFFSNKSDNTQDAHEAIRPSYVEMNPDDIKDSLNDDQYKLYKLIWTRFVASRMAPATYDSCSVDIKAGKYTLRATGRKLNFEGFLKVYPLHQDEKDKQLPALSEQEILKLLDVNAESKKTEPPSRFTEASLIKELEEKGIGRPSTYAPIVSTLIDRHYIKKEKKSLFPTELGMKITREIMDVYFKDVVDVGFTSAMESNLDMVADGKLPWKKVVSDYYGTLSEEIKTAKEQAEKVQKTPEFTGENCPQCGKPLVKRNGKYGAFVGCSGYPSCRYIQKKEAAVIGTGVACPKCQKEIVQKRSKKGKIFYGCSGYPDCDQVYWYKPVNRVCPSCGALLVEKGKKLCCSNNECKFSENI